jgi:hypothetical protein
MLLTLLTSPAASAQAPALVPGDAVILASPDDAYYALAEEIAQHEALLVVHSLDEAVARGPTFLLWVVSPSRLSEQALIELGLAVHDRQQVISTGIISGSTLEQAQQLWRRASQTKGQRVYAVNAANPTAHILEGQISTFDGGQYTSQPLTKANLTHALQNADHLTFTGHGGNGYWRLDEDVKLVAADIPDLPPVVISSGGCQTFRIWTGDSIARRFTDQGAAAYAGFAYSPNEGYLIGEFDGLPFRYTWPDFPIGHVVQVQSHGALQGYAHFPFYYLLGDPRIALQAEPPYRVVNDYEERDVRTLTYADAPAGTIPVRIPGGARYSFIAIPGITAAGEDDPLYNSRLQMVDIGNDKYVLFIHKGGDFELRLRARPPWYWRSVDLLTDSLDHTLVYIQQAGGGDVASVVFAGVALTLTAWLLRSRKGATRALIPAALTGPGFAALHGLYQVARLDHVTITSKPVEFTLLSLVGTFLLTGCSTFLFLNARSRLARGIALLVTTFPAWSAAGFGLAVIAYGNLHSRARLGTDVWNYTLGLMPLGTFVFECILFGLTFVLLHRRWPLLDGRPRRSPGSQPEAT